MLKGKLPQKIKGLIGTIDFCPRCRDNIYKLDNRYTKGTGKRQTNCRIIKYSKLGITLECRTCEFRFSASWQAIQKALEYSVDKDYYDTDKQSRNVKWLEWLKIWIGCRFDIQSFVGQTCRDYCFG